MLKAVFEHIDQANLKHPSGEIEVLYSKRMLDTLTVFKPTASEALTLACYAQHVCRWQIKRDEFPKGRDGYLAWRTRLAKLHATVLADAMTACGYDDNTIDRAKSIVQKRKLKTDPEAQTLEDVSCLVFLEHYFERFAQKHAEEKLIDILQKTWGKMSPEGHQAALQLNLPEHLQGLVAKALA